MKKLNERQKEILKHIGDLQITIQDNNLEEYSELISFYYKGQDITNPMIDSSGRFNVEPIEYYGESFLNSKFMELIK